MSNLPATVTTEGCEIQVQPMKVESSLHIGLDSYMKNATIAIEDKCEPAQKACDAKLREISRQREETNRELHRLGDIAVRAVKPGAEAQKIADDLSKYEAETNGTAMPVDPSKRAFHVDISSGNTDNKNLTITVIQTIKKRNGGYHDSVTSSRTVNVPYTPAMRKLLEALEASAKLHEKIKEWNDALALMMINKKKVLDRVEAKIAGMHGTGKLGDSSVIFKVIEQVAGEMLMTLPGDIDEDLMPLLEGDAGGIGRKKSGGRRTKKIQSKRRR